MYKKLSKKEFIKRAIKDLKSGKSMKLTEAELKFEAQEKKRYLIRKNKNKYRELDIVKADSIQNNKKKQNSKF